MSGLGEEDSHIQESIGSKLTDVYELICRQVLLRYFFNLRTSGCGKRESLSA